MDRALRERSYFARAVRGNLEAPEYRALVAQWAHLVASSVPTAGPLLKLAAKDVGTIDDVAPCPSVVLARVLVSAVEDDLASLPALALLGTSWASDAAESLHERGHSAEFLTVVARRGADASEVLQQRLEAGAVDPMSLIAVVDALRGIVLGVSGYLDTLWDTPVLHATFNIGEPTVLTVARRGRSTSTRGQIG